MVETERQPDPDFNRSYGLIADFADQHRLVDAIRRVRAAGYRRIEAYIPFPDEEVFEALEYRSTPIPRIMFLGGMVGCITGFLLPYWVSVVAYPINVGGRPLDSVPSWVPIMFELTVLFAGLSGFIGWFIINGLPRPHHPLFNAPSFSLATKDRFILAIEARDPHFNPIGTRAFLASLGPREVSDVPERP